MNDLMTAPTLPITRTLTALRQTVATWRSQGLRVGFVPTMGALHAGHLALVAEAGRQADRVVASVFVNPTQFAPHEDLATYPRREAEDAALLASAGCHLMYAPSVETMYPQGSVTRILVGDGETGGPSQGLEGQFRPQMFAGVALVVAKLFNQVGADVAVFGEKDWQQLKVIQRMVADLDIATRIVGVRTLRDDHGLALSSRNAYLTDADLAIARRLNTVLTAAAARIEAGTSPTDAEAWASQALLEAGFHHIDYVAVRRANDLAEVRSLAEGPLRILAAAWLGKTRLIDNKAVG